jgi:hypothetical protein
LVFKETLLKPLLKRFADPTERCREASIELATRCIACTADAGPILPYFFPALLQRGLGSNWSLDAELMVFIHDRESHDARKRGKVIDPVRSSAGNFDPDLLFVELIGKPPLPHPAATLPCVIHFKFRRISVVFLLLRFLKKSGSPLLCY